MENTGQRVEKFKKLNLYREKNELWENSGFQVIMCAHNMEFLIGPTLATVARSMKGLKWGFIFGDDGSEDGTLSRVQNLTDDLGADFVELRSFPKMANVSMVKNSLAEISKEYSDDYPGILFCDADDFIKKDKVTGLFSKAKETNANITIGDWIYSNDKLKKFELKTAGESLEKMSFGPWNTLIHSSLIPEDGKFWNESLMAHADLLAWWELRAAGVEFEMADVVTTEYNAHFGSISKSRQVNLKQLYWTSFLNEKNKIIDYAGLEDVEGAHSLMEKV
jgi:glycosyltransferase involved in cell wall biosynthesis